MPAASAPTPPGPPPVSPHAGSPVEPAPAAPPVHAPRGGWLWRALSVGALVVALVGLAAVWQRSEQIAREAARRLQAGEARVQQLEQQLKLSQDTLRDTQNRAAVLESKLAETIGQQSQLEKLYRDRSPDGIDAVLADVENAVAIAGQQLQLGGNVAAALVTLQDAERRLSARADPAFIPVRRALGRDIERLRALPAVDLTAIALRLDAILGGLDQYPLLATLAPRGDARQEGRAESKADGRSDARADRGASRLAQSGREGLDALRGELQQLFRVRRIDEPDAVLLAPEQAYFVRQNLRLALLSARLAALSRNEATYRVDVERSARMLADYFDRGHKGVDAALASLRQLQANRFAMELPGLGDSLAAVRSARAARETPAR